MFPCVRCPPSIKLHTLLYDLEGPRAPLGVPSWNLFVDRLSSRIPLANVRDRCNLASRMVNSSSRDCCSLLSRRSDTIDPFFSGQPETSLSHKAICPLIQKAQLPKHRVIWSGRDSPYLATNFNDRMRPVPVVLRRLAFSLHSYFRVLAAGYYQRVVLAFPSSSSNRAMGKILRS
jgi:hypothetical protein